MVATMRVMDERHQAYSLTGRFAGLQTSRAAAQFYIASVDRSDSQAVVPAAVSGRIRK
jgi:hypothetical protein